MTLAKGFQLANHLLLITERLFENHFQPQQQQESDEASARIYGVGVSTFIRLMSNLALHTIFRKVSIILALPMLASVFLSTILAVAIGGLSLQPIGSEFEQQQQQPSISRFDAEHFSYDDVDFKNINGVGGSGAAAADDYPLLLSYYYTSGIPSVVLPQLNDPLSDDDSQSSSTRNKIRLLSVGPMLLKTVKSTIEKMKPILLLRHHHHHQQ